ncbi:MAG: 3-deoxy-7-phosphoheptulonate synthase [Planctomycetota bacterium]
MSTGPVRPLIQPSLPTEDLNVLSTNRLLGPRQVKDEVPAGSVSQRTVIESRAAIQRILSGADQRLLVVVGPCSIHDQAAACEYAERLNGLRRELEEHLCIVMRVYFEKPRTTVGWKGLINDPHLDGSFDMDTGIRTARRILGHVTEIGLPAGTELLDPITPQYLADLLTWAAVGARTTESQTHRQMASGLSMPVGFKNGTDGSLQSAIDALATAGHPHSFLGIDQEGLTAIVRTRGNPWGHLILRGGRSGPNYAAETIAAATAALEQARLTPRLMVDCSHANSGKKSANQAIVWRSALQQRQAGNTALIGLMLESNLREGHQQLNGDLTTLKYGVSITDECIGWGETEELLREAHARLTDAW